MCRLACFWPCSWRQGRVLPGPSLGIHLLMQLTAGSWESARTRHEPHQDRRISIFRSSSTCWQRRQEKDCSIARDEIMNIRSKDDL
jgi:hypothetical protein